MEAALDALWVSVATCQTLENGLRGKPPNAEPKARANKSIYKEKPPTVPAARSVEAVLDTCLQACTESRKRHRAEAGSGDDLSDHGLSQYTRFTDEIALDVYKKFLHYVPRLVNVVSK